MGENKWEEQEFAQEVGESKWESKSSPRWRAKNVQKEESCPDAGRKGEEKKKFARLKYRANKLVL